MAGRVRIGWQPPLDLSKRFRRLDKRGGDCHPFWNIFFLSLLFSQAVYAQDFSSIDTDLQALENLINDTLLNTAEQQKLLEDLKQNLDESGNLIANYEKIITERKEN